MLIILIPLTIVYREIKNLIIKFKLQKNIY